MERVLFWHPDLPHTKTNPVSRLAKRQASMEAQGWRLFPPSGEETPTLDEEE